MRDELKKSILCTAPVPVIGVGLVAPLCAFEPLRTDLLLGLSAVVSLIVTGAGIALWGLRISANVRIGVAVLIAGVVLTIAKIYTAAFLPGGSVPVETLAPLIFSAAVIAASTEAYAVKKKLPVVLFDGMGIGLSFTLLLSVCGVLRDMAVNSGIFSFFTSTPGLFFMAALVAGGSAMLSRRVSKGAS